MNKRRTLIIALAAAAVGLFALILGAYFFREPKGGTPIIIKGFDDGSGGELLTIEGLQQNSPSGKGDVTKIKVTADEKWWLYESPDNSNPVITLVTDPLNSTDPDCNVNVTDLLVLTKIEVEFKQSVFTWNANRFETKKCTARTLKIDLRDHFWSGKTVCTNSNGSPDCQLEIDVKSVKELTIYINEP